MIGKVKSLRSYPPSYATDNTGNPASVTGDHVFTQTENTYDADGNITLAVTRSRLSSDGTVTGVLGDIIGNGGLFGVRSGNLSITHISGH